MNTQQAIMKLLDLIYSDIEKLNNSTKLMIIHLEEYDKNITK